MPDNTLPKPASTQPGSPMGGQTTGTAFQPGVRVGDGQKPFQSPVSSTTTTSSPGFRVTTTASQPVSKPSWTPSANPMATSTTVTTPVAQTTTTQTLRPTQSLQSGPVGQTLRPGAAVPPPGSSGKTPVTPGGSTPTGTQPKKSIFRLFPLLLLLLLIFGLIGFGAYWFFGRGTTGTTGTDTPAVNKKTIVYWGLWEPTTVVQQVLADFEKQNPDYKVQYIQQSHKEYRERLQAEIAKGSGPDVFRFHASWTPMLRNELSPLPEKIMTKEEFSQTFYPVAQQQLTSGTDIVGMPLMIDGLGLYYNKDIFNIANKTPPKNWEEMKVTARELTIRSGGKITRGGIALGEADNVEHFSEILALLMLQNGANPADPTSPQAIEAINFYFDFATKQGVWDKTLPNATVAFGKGDVAMMIAPSWRVHEIKAANPNLQFDIVPVPQLPDKERTTWASFWAEGVSTQSKEKEGSWLLLNYLSSADVQKKLYSDATAVRAFGEIYSRRDLADQIADRPYVGAYLQDIPFAKTWYVNAYTHDNGLNDRIIKYYLDLVNKGQGNVTDNVGTAKLGITQVLQTYGLAPAAPASSGDK